MTRRVSIDSREVRITRAYEQVLARYTIAQRPDDHGWFVFSVEGGSRPYEVRVHSEWREGPTCTCPDASDLGARLNRGYCKHLIGVLRKHEHVSYQLLELYL